MSEYTGEKPAEHQPMELGHEIPVQRKRPPRVRPIITGSLLSLAMLSSFEELLDWSTADKVEQNIIYIVFFVAGLLLIWLGVRGGFGKR